MAASKKRYEADLDKECKRLSILYPFLPNNQIQNKAKQSLANKKTVFNLRHEVNNSKGKKKLDFINERPQDLKRITNKPEPIKNSTANNAKQLVSSTKLNGAYKTKTVNGKVVGDELKPCSFMDLGGASSFTADEQVDIFQEVTRNNKTQMANPRPTKSLAKPSHKFYLPPNSTTPLEKSPLYEKLFCNLTSHVSPPKRATPYKRNPAIISISSESEESGGLDLRDMTYSETTKCNTVSLKAKQPVATDKDSNLNVVSGNAEIDGISLCVKSYSVTQKRNVLSLPAKDSITTEKNTNVKTSHENITASCKVVNKLTSEPIQKLQKTSEANAKTKQPCTAKEKTIDSNNNREETIDGNTDHEKAIDRNNHQKKTFDRKDYQEKTLNTNNQGRLRVVSKKTTPTYDRPLNRRQKVISKPSTHEKTVQTEPCEVKPVQKLCSKACQTAQQQTFQPKLVSFGTQTEHEYRTENIKNSTNMNHYYYSRSGNNRPQQSTPQVSWKEDMVIQSTNGAYKEVRQEFSLDLRMATLTRNNPRINDNQLSNLDSSSDSSEGNILLCKEAIRDTSEDTESEDTSTEFEMIRPIEYIGYRDAVRMPEDPYSYSSSPSTDTSFHHSYNSGAASESESSLLTKNLGNINTYQTPVKKRTGIPQLMWISNPMEKKPNTPIRMPNAENRSLFPAEKPLNVLLSLQSTTSALQSLQPSTSMLQSLQHSTSAMQSLHPSISVFQSIRPSVSALQSLPLSTAALQITRPSASALQSLQPSTSVLQNLQPSTSMLQSVQPSTSTLKEILATIQDIADGILPHSKVEGADYEEMDIDVTEEIFYEPVKKRGKIVRNLTNTNSSRMSSTQGNMKQSDGLLCDLFDTVSPQP